VSHRSHLNTKCSKLVGGWNLPKHHWGLQHSHSWVWKARGQLGKRKGEEGMTEQKENERREGRSTSSFTHFFYHWLICGSLFFVARK